VARPAEVAFVALGCAKNLVDSEKMLGQLAEAGAVITSDGADADVIVINTCGFLEASRQEAHEVIREAIERKRRGRCRRVVVAGCLVQRDGRRLLEVFPEIDALVGVHNREDVVKAALSDPVPVGRRGGRAADVYLGEHPPYYASAETARLRLTPRHYAYLRISEGCNQRCTFCTIPAIRGPMRCKTPGLILEEARELIADGALELNLIGQDTTSYGEDIGYEPGLPGLLRELDRLPGVRWIRLLYAYPSVFTDAMIEAIADGEHVVKYVDLPLQHINDRVLRAMGRGVTRARTEALLDRIRSRIPGVAIRTTLIAGFPGETEAEFEELLAFIRGFRFDALGVFAYSREPETPAGRMRDQIPDDVKRRRVEALMAAQQEIAFDLARRQVGRSFEVLVESAPARENGLLVQRARHAGQAPEVDSVTFVEGGGLRPGEVAHVCCVGARGYDLIARCAGVSLAVSAESAAAPVPPGRPGG